MLSPQGCRVLIAPFPSTAGIAGRCKLCSARGFDVLLTLADQNEIRLENFGKPIQHAASTVQVPRPTTVAIWSALSEILRLEADYLKKQLPAFIPIVVLLHDSR